MPYLSKHGPAIVRSVGAQASTACRRANADHRCKRENSTAPSIGYSTAGGAGASRASSRAHKSTDLKSLSPGWRDGGTEAQLGILAGSCFTRMYGPVWVIRYRSLVASPDAMSEVARKLT